ncbi:MAG: hypothetical protein PHH54_04790 [Candidatus Nanoarchaeia archaeon]|nr:hypothetical protein [Candidatus Nanoarchaeia archaeon]MDD5741274.1 hypothetical protein [Candidatus Nanoarchaeia archaeon]
MKEINVRDSLRYLKTGTKIARAFKKEGLTMYRAIALMELYSRGKLPRRELKENVGIKNEGQFTRDVITPLIEQDYIEYLKYANPKILRNAQKGKDLVDRVLIECGYSKYQPAEHHS